MEGMSGEEVEEEVGDVFVDEEVEEGLIWATVGGEEVEAEVEVDSRTQLAR